MKLKLVSLTCLLCACLYAQAPSSSGSPSGPPAYVLYRLFFRDLAGLDAAAAKSDAAALPGGDEARAWYQGVLHLTAAEAAALKQSARQCIQTLDQHQQKAQPVIAAVQAANATSTPGPVPQQLIALEQERAALSSTCIQNLHAAMGDRKFADIDVFVHTKFAQKVSAIPPPNAPFANVPVTRTSAGGGK